MKKAIYVIVSIVMTASAAAAQSSGFGLYDVQRSPTRRSAIIHDYQTGETIEAWRRLGGVEVFNHGSMPTPSFPPMPAMPPPVFEGHRYGQEWTSWGNFTPQDD